MGSHTLDIRQYRFHEHDRLLLDANIWLFVYGPSPKQTERTRVYSAALRDMIASHSAIVLDVLVLSEFINRFARIEYGQLPPGLKPKDFKRFRNSPAFKPIAKDITVTVRNIMRIASRRASGFESADIDALLTAYELGSSDFNDLMLAELCKAQSLAFVTDDADFQGSDISILTANQRLLRANN